METIIKKKLATKASKKSPLTGVKKTNSSPIRKAPQLGDLIKEAIGKDNAISKRKKVSPNSGEMGKTPVPGVVGVITTTKEVKYKYPIDSDTGEIISPNQRKAWRSKVRAKLEKLELAVQRAGDTEDREKAEIILEKYRSLVLTETGED